jgi:putative oxidoreductase
MNTMSQAARPGTAATSPTAVAYPMRDVAALLGRVLIAALFVWSGFGKFAGFAGTAGYIASVGLPMPELLAALAIVVELGLGLALLVGLKARWAALGIAFFLIVITPIFHGFWAVPPEQVQMQQINFMKNVAILGGLLMVFAFGPGRYSIDRG